MEQIKMKFSVTLHSDGRQSKYGNEYSLSLEEAVDNLHYYNVVNHRHTKDSLLDLLTTMKTGATNAISFGGQWNEIRVCKYDQN